MKKNLLRYALFIGGCIFFTSCIEVEPEQLPSITTQGLETFGCMVNGNVWLPKKDYTLFEDIPLIILDFLPSKSDSEVTILATNTKLSSSFSIRIFHANILGNIADTDFTFFYSSNDNSIDKKFSFKKEPLRNFQIKLLRADWGSNDTVFIAGIFNGTLLNSDHDSVVIEDGRFDLTNMPKKK